MTKNHIMYKEILQKLSPGSISRHRPINPEDTVTQITAIRGLGSSKRKRADCTK